MELVRDILKEWKFTVGFILFALLCVYLFIAMSFTVSAEVACLQRGYPQYRVTVSLTAYCIRVENGSSVIVKLEEIGQ